MTLMLRWPCRASAYHKPPFGEMAATSWVGLHGILWVGARHWGLPMCWECPTGVSHRNLGTLDRDHSHENLTSPIRPWFGNCTEPLKPVGCETHRGGGKGCGLRSDQGNSRFGGIWTQGGMPKYSYLGYGGDHSMRK